MKATGVTCGECGEKLASQSVEKCPKCGSTSKTVAVEGQARGIATVTVKATWTKTRRFVEKNWPLLIGTAAIVLGTPFFGLWLSGWWSVGASLAFNLASAWLGYLAITKVREITRGP